MHADTKVTAGRTPAHDILGRIDHRLQKVHLSDRAASLAAGASADLIRSARRQQRTGKVHSISRRSLEALAVPLRTNVEWLEYGTGQEERMDANQRAAATGVVDASPRRGMARLGGVVLVGAWFNPDTATGLEGERIEVPFDPRYAARVQAAYLLRDDSANRVAPTGSYLIAADPEAASLVTPIVDQLLVIERRREVSSEEVLREISIRRVVKSPQGLELHLNSSAARFRAMLPLAIDDPEVAVRGVVVAAYLPIT